MNKYNLSKETLKEIYLKKLTKDVLNEMKESGELDEISLRGLKNVASKGLDKLGDSAKNIYDKTKDGVSKTIDKVGDKVKSSVDAVNKEYQTGVMADFEEKIANQLDKIIDSLTKHNTLAKKYGKPTINPQKFLGKFNKVIKEDDENKGVDEIFVSGEYGNNVPKMFARKVLNGKILTKNGRNTKIISLLNDLTNTNSDTYLDSWGDLLFKLIGIDNDGNEFKFTEDDMGNVVKKK